MPSPGPLVTIAATSERAPLWFRIFGRFVDIPVTTFTPHTVDLPGRPGAQVYLLSSTRLTPAERQNLLEYMQSKYGMGRSEAELYLEMPGVMVYADDTLVSSPPIVSL